MTSSEKEQASARARARQEQITRARAQFNQMPSARRTALRASYARAESDAVEVVRARRGNDG